MSTGVKDKISSCMPWMFVLCEKQIPFILGHSYFTWGETQISTSWYSSMLDKYVDGCIVGLMGGYRASSLVGWGEENDGRHSEKGD